jgi:hypothetical protein
MATVNRRPVLVAAESFVIWDEGRMVRFRRNRTTIEDGHRYLDGQEHRFRPFAVTFPVDPPVEPRAAKAQPARVKPAEAEAPAEAATDTGTVTD